MSTPSKKYPLRKGKQLLVQFNTNSISAKIVDTEENEIIVSEDFYPTDIESLIADYFDKEVTHTLAMNKLQEEWKSNQEYHKEQRYKNDAGIRSSQISALIAFLVKTGVIKDEDL